MKIIKTYFVSCLLLCSIFLSLSESHAGFRIRLEKDVTYTNLFSTGINNVVSFWDLTFNIYDNSTTPPTLITTQSFLASNNEWEVDYNISNFEPPGAFTLARFRVEFTETDALTKDMDLLVEMTVTDNSNGNSYTTPQEPIKQEAWALFSEESKTVPWSGITNKPQNIGIPSGVIVMWSGSVVPYGWVL